MVDHRKKLNATRPEARSVLSQYVGEDLGGKPVEPKTPARSFSVKRTLKRIVITVLVIALIFGGWLGYTFYNNVAKITGNSNPFQVLSLFLPAHLNETNGRVNILVAGNSTDDPGHEGATLTDSIMLISVNPKTKTAVLLSIPRDTWVHVPGFGYSKINAAYQDGQQENFSQPGYASGGMGLLEQVVQQDFGVMPNYYALVNYSAVRNAVNAVGGITLTINSPDPRGLYDPYTHLNLPNGSVTLNGQEALNLSRARGDGPGSYGFPQADFNRTQYQQQILIALKDKARGGNIFTRPVKAAKLANAVGPNVKTDMSLNGMVTMYGDTQGINNSSIKTVTLNNYQGQDLLRSYGAPDGESALIPAAGFDNWSQIQSAVNDLLYGS